MFCKKSYSIKARTTTLALVVASLLATSNVVQASDIDPDQGLRADWLKGALGVLWLPEKTYNGNIEGVTIDEFIEQMVELRTLDYVQIPLTSPNIYSPTHTAPHDVIESLWEGDLDEDGEPLNLVVPRSTAEDPFLSWLLALREAGLKSEIYVNSYNLLARYEDSIPDAYPDLSERWMEWCDTDEEAQEFLNSESYYGNDEDSRRKYMFCYAEFILKEYAVRYGDLIDAWVFDSADNIMEDEGGDDPDSESVDDQRIYEAFANAVHEGNPDAAVAFNNSVGTAAKPFATPTLFDDYTFGHPFGGAGDMVETDSLYTRNFYITELMGETGGLPFKEDDRDWNNKVVGHFFPKQSTTSWNGGKTACLTDDEFVEWTATGIIDGGAITWGTPLVTNNLENKAPNLTLQDYALDQLLLADEHLKEFQAPGKPNWARQYTTLPAAVAGEAYSHTLTADVDFWDPEGDEINKLYIVDTDSAPAWLTITETSTGVWTLSGTPTENGSIDYTFRLRVKSASGGTNRSVDLSVEGFGSSLVEIAKVRATDNDGNASGNTLDDDLTTRWSAKGDEQKIMYTLAETKTIDRIDIAFYKGNERKSYFEIEVSVDANTWVTLFDGKQAKFNQILQQYDVEPTMAKYVRYVGHGNATNTWNSLTEVDIYGY